MSFITLKCLTPRAGTSVVLMPIVRQLEKIKNPPSVERGK